MSIIFKCNLRKWHLRTWRHSVLHGISYHCPLSSNSYEIYNVLFCHSVRLWVRKVMLTVFWGSICLRICRYVYICVERERGTTTYTFRYSDNKDCRRLFDETQWITFGSLSSARDNPRPLAAPRTVANIENKKFEVCLHLPHIPDLASRNCYLVGRLKGTSESRKFCGDKGRNSGFKTGRQCHPCRRWSTCTEQQSDSVQK